MNEVRLMELPARSHVCWGRRLSSWSPLSPYEEPSDEGAVTVKLWIYVMAGGAIAAYIASIAAKSMFAPLS